MWSQMSSGLIFNHVGARRRYGQAVSAIPEQGLTICQNFPSDMWPIYPLLPVVEQRIEESVAFSSAALYLRPSGCFLWLEMQLCIFPASDYCC
eukprot:4135876-Amphidinium_carterae.1